MYAQHFGTGQKWMPAIVQDVTGPVSFLVKLKDGCLIRRHQDHLLQKMTFTLRTLLSRMTFQRFLLTHLRLNQTLLACDRKLCLDIRMQGGLTTRNTQESTTVAGSCPRF